MDALFDWYYLRTCYRAFATRDDELQPLDARDFYTSPVNSGCPLHRFMFRNARPRDIDFPTALDMFKERAFSLQCDKSQKNHIGLTVLESQLIDFYTDPASNTDGIPTNSLFKIENIAMIVAIGAKVTHGPFNFSSFDTALFNYRHTDAAKIIFQSGYSLTRVDPSKMYGPDKELEEFMQSSRKVKTLKEMAANVIRTEMTPNVLVALEQLEEVSNGGMPEEVHRYFLCDPTPVNLKSSLSNCFNRNCIFCRKKC